MAMDRRQSRAQRRRLGFKQVRNHFVYCSFRNAGPACKASLSPRPTSVSVHAHRTIAKALNSNLRNARLGDCRCELLVGFDPGAHDVALHIIGEDREHAGQSAAAGRAQVECFTERDV
jgi:hypothetical protein